MALQMGQILNNRYRIAKQIGQGGFGAVYRAWDTRMNGACVVKENLDTSQEARNQFEREAQILFRLRHPGLPVVFDYFSEPDQGLYLVMDFVDGKNLEEMQLAAGGLLNEADTILWISQVCEALEYLHNNTPPVIHRDIKPQNIIITPARRAVLVDFGVAKLFQAQQKTTIGARAVTPGYSPPEQYLQTGTDACSDIYSLGATMYTLLSGQVPPESVALGMGENLPSIQSFNSTILPKLEAIVYKAMAPQKNQRFTSAVEMREALLELSSFSTGPVIKSGKQKPNIISPQPEFAPALPSAVPSTMHLAHAVPVRVKPRKPINWLAIALGSIGGFLGLAIIAAAIFLPGLIKDRPSIAIGSTKTEKVTQPAEVAETSESTQTPVPEPTEAPVITQFGGWLDEITVSVVSFDSAITQLESGTIDVYTGALQPSEYDAIKSAGLQFATSYGLFYDLTFNPVGPVFQNGSFNPFSSPRIREAMNWLIDRNYINQEVFFGKGLPRYFAISPGLPEYNGVLDKAKELEDYYSYDMSKANEAITAEMKSMGAVMSGGKWTYNGTPVTLIFLIRTDSDGNRLPIGDYIANQLETIGFTVDRQYKLSSETGPIWIGSEPAEGQWHIYTGAWANDALAPHESDVFMFYFTPSGMESPLWQAYKPSNEFLQLAEQIDSNSFSSMSARENAIKRALELSLQESVRIFILENQNYSPYRQEVELAIDTFAGIETAQIWPYTLRISAQKGGKLVIGTELILGDTWNPIAGSTWTSDKFCVRATQSGDVMADPKTGLTWPLRIEKAVITVPNGTLVSKTLDWIDLEYVNEIIVPGDAWVDWDPTAQTFVSSSDVNPTGLKVQRKTTVYYPSNMFETVTWHDGSPLSVADFIMHMIISFDRSKPESTLYDEFGYFDDQFRSAFRAVKIISTDPLVIEYYSDVVNLDAERNIPTLYPTYNLGEASWAMLAVSSMAEANGELAYSFEKATKLGVEWTNYVSGPSLSILAKYLDQAKSQNFIPYTPTLSKYITQDEAKLRYTNLTNWYDVHGHFWVGTGPYYLDRVNPGDSTLLFKRFESSPDNLEGWAKFIQP